MRNFFKLGHFIATHPLTSDAQIGAWLRFVSWQIRSRLQHEVIWPWIGGQRLAVRRGMSGATGNMYVGLHEFPDMLLALHFLSEGDLFLDIGANIGSYTILASGVRRATTWAFEPDPNAARTLRRNMEINGLEHRVVVYEHAVGNCDGEISFTAGLDTVNHVATRADTAVQVVKIKRLDTLLGTARPVMMKIDVEGFEEQVLGGASRLLACDSLKLIEIETVTPEIEKVLQCHDFERVNYDPFRRTFSIGLLATHASNSFYVRDLATVSKKVRLSPAVTILGKSI